LITFNLFLSRKDIQIGLKTNDYSEKLYFDSITNPQRTSSSSGLAMDAYLEQQTRGAFAEHNGNYDDPGATRM
jgi:hypothetical protein